MEIRQLSRAAERALQSCSLLRSRIQSVRPLQLSSLPRQSIALASTTSDPPPLDTLSHDLPRYVQEPPDPPGYVRRRPTIRLRPQKQPPFRVNEDPKKLDDMYVALLGRSGDLMLPAHLKWLAVTHKSFDHGWQGNNDRLAFLGKRIMDLQVSLALLSMPRLRKWGEDEGDEPQRFGLVDGLENLTVLAKSRLQDPRRVANLARQSGLQDVMRWKPKKVKNLQSSGVDTVVSHTLYAIVGALSLHRGSVVTENLVKERLLAPLGLRA